MMAHAPPHAIVVLVQGEIDVARVTRLRGACTLALDRLLWHGFAIPFIFSVHVVLPRASSTITTNRNRLPGDRRSVRGVAPEWSRPFPRRPAPPSPHPSPLRP